MFLSLVLKSPISWNRRSFSGVVFFIFLSSKSYFLKYKKVYKTFFQVFRFPKYKNGFVLENIRNLFEVSLSWIIRNFLGVNFFILIFGWKVQSFICRNIRTFLIIELEGSTFWNMRKFFWSRLFVFWAWA